MTARTLWSRRRVLGGLSAAVLALPGCEQRKRSTTASGLRVASQTVLSDEVLWDLGAAARETVVAVSTMADDVRYSRVQGQWPTSIPRAAGSSEALLAVAPTLVILASFTAAETLRLIEQAGLKTLVLKDFDGFEDYRGNVRAIAKAIGMADAGETLVATFDTRLDTLRRPVAPTALRVLSWNEGSVPAANTSFHDVVEAAGYRHLPAEQGKSGHLQVTVEQLVAWDPDVIVVPCDGDNCETTTRELAARPGIAATRAARSGRIVGVPSRDLYSVGSGMLDVVERLHDTDATAAEAPP